VWVSNPALEDKAGPKEKVKGRYILTAKTFKVKFRNIAGDEIILEFPAPAPVPAQSENPKTAKKISTPTKKPSRKSRK